MGDSPATSAKKPQSPRARVLSITRSPSTTASGYRGVARSSPSTSERSSATRSS